MRGFRGITTFTLLLLLVCGGISCASRDRRDPAPLVAIPKQSAFSLAWKNNLDGRIAFPLYIGGAQDKLAVATSPGGVALIDSRTGADVWRIQLNEELTAGVGFDGRTAAVATANNELLALQQATHKTNATVLWRKPLQAKVYTPPLVAGGRIFVLAGDRSLQAFDADTGESLWNLKRAADPLILAQAGALGVYGNRLLVGHSGRLLVVNPDNGQVESEVMVATSRATNDIERLIDLVGTPNRVGDSVCVRSFQMRIACLDMSKMTVAWSRTSQGATGLSGDSEIVVSVESDSRVKAWNRKTGDLLWMNEQLTYRDLSTPLVLGNSIVVGDFQGYVHVLNKATGQFVARFATEGSPIVSPPIVMGATVVVATANGHFYAFRPR